MDDVAAAGQRVVFFQAAKHFVERQPVARQPVGVGAHFVGFVEPAVRVDLGDAAHFTQLRSDIPIEDRPQLHRREAFVATHLELQNLAERGRQRSELRRSIAGGNLFHRDRQSFGHELPRAVNVGSFLEDNRHDRYAKLRDAPQFLDLRQTAHRRLDREREVAFDFDWRQRPSFGDDLHLHVRHVRHRVDRQMHRRIDPQRADQAGQHEDQEAIRE